MLAMNQSSYRRDRRENLFEKPRRLRSRCWQTSLASLRNTSALNSFVDQRLTGKLRRNSPVETSKLSESSGAQAKWKRLDARALLLVYRVGTQIVRTLTALVWSNRVAKRRRTIDLVRSLWFSRLAIANQFHHHGCYLVAFPSFRNAPSFSLPRQDS